MLKYACRKGWMDILKKGRIYNIAFATGSRADYGIVRKYLSLLDEDSGIHLEILVTGALLSEEYGRQVALIEQDGFQIGKEVMIPVNAKDNAAVIHTMAFALDEFGKMFETQRYDLLILLGDRYEIFSVATAAAMQRIPVLHIHGGEITYGNYDEFIRHSITKMADFHFASTEKYRHRLIQMGENPECVYNLGALGAENCLAINMLNVPDDIKKLSQNEYFVVLFHPETLTGERPIHQIKTIVAALEHFAGKQFVFIGSNADTASNKIREYIQQYAKVRENAFYYENIHSDAYHYLLKNAVCLVGNSSSGIIEAPSLGTWSINIGRRQEGREKGKSVIDVECNLMEIVGAIKGILHDTASDMVFYNPYYQKDTAEHYFSCTMQILDRLRKSRRDGAKVFYDVEF